MRIKTKTVAVHWVAWNQLIYSFERKVLCQTAPRINQNHLSSSVVLLTPAEVKSKLTEIYVQHDTWANMSFSWLYHDPLLHVFPAIMTCMRLFFNFVLVDIIFCVLFFVFHTHLVLFVYPPFFGWMHFLCVCVVTSCPVLEFELRKAKETIQALRTNLTQAAGVAFFLPFLKLKPFYYSLLSFLVSFVNSCGWLVLSIFPDWSFFSLIQRVKFPPRRGKTTNPVLKFRWVNLKC